MDSVWSLSPTSFWSWTSKMQAWSADRIHSCKSEVHLLMKFVKYVEIFWKILSREFLTSFSWAKCIIMMKFVQYFLLQVFEMTPGTALVSGNLFNTEVNIEALGDQFYIQENWSYCIHINIVYWIVVNSLVHDNCWSMCIYTSSVQKSSADAWWSTLTDLLNDLNCPV